MPFAGFQRIADLHDADSAFGLGNIVFPFLWRIVREHGFQLLGGNKENIVGKDFFYVIVLDGHELFRFAQYLIYNAHDILQRVKAAFLFGYDFFPVPLIHVDGVDIVRNLIPAYGAHISIEAFAGLEAVFFQREAFPFGQRLYDLGFVIILFLDAESYGTLNPVQVIVQAGSRVYKKRRRYTQQVQPFCQQRLKEVLYRLNADLGIVEGKG